MGQEDLADASETKTPIMETMIHPPSHFPQPEPPAGLARSHSAGPEPSLSQLLLDKTNTFFSSAILKRISSLHQQQQEDDPSDSVRTIHLSGLKVTVRPLDDGDYDDVKGRISFFSRSGCRDCTAVRSFFRSKNLPFVEINLDVFGERERELVERTRGCAVPAVFFNERLVGGLVALNGLRNSGEFETRMREMAGKRCDERAPKVPVYGFDDEAEERGRGEDGMVGVVRVLRMRLPIADRIVRMKIAKNCFPGAGLVDAVDGYLDCGREKVCFLIH